MLLPRFSIRTTLAMITAAAMVFVIVGMAYRGQNWAWGVTIAVISLGIIAIVHAAWFGLAWMFAQMPSAQTSATANATVTSERLNPEHPNPDRETSANRNEGSA
jgi:hypothetical protein